MATFAWPHARATPVGEYVLSPFSIMGSTAALIATSIGARVGLQTQGPFQNKKTFAGAVFALLAVWTPIAKGYCTFGELLYRQHCCYDCGAHWGEDIKPGMDNENSAI